MDLAGPVVTMAEMRRTSLRWALGLTGACGVVSLLLFLLASRTAYLPGAVGLCVLGVIAALGGFVSFEPTLFRVAQRQGFVADALPWVLIGPGVGLIVLALAGGGASWFPGGLVTPVCLAGILLSLFGAFYVDKRIDAGRITLPRGLVAVGGTILVVAVLVLSGTVYDAPALVRLVAAAAALGGYVLAKIGLPDALDKKTPETQLRWAGRLAVVLGAGGLVAWWLAPRWHSGFLVVLGAVLIAAGLTMGAEWVLRRDDERLGRPPPGRRLAWGVAGAGVVLGLFGGWQALQVLGEWRWMIALIAGLVAVVGMFFIFRGEGLVIGVILGFVLVWSLYDRTTQTETWSDSDTPLVLILGDSYAAGQGHNRFYEANNTIPASERDDPCRRSADAYGARLADKLGWDVVNLACSGAESNEIYEEGQHSAGPARVSQLDQLRGLPSEVLDRITLVVLSVGGNDAEFATVASICILPADCTETQDHWHRIANDLGPPEPVAQPTGDVFEPRTDPLSVMFTALRVALTATVPAKPNAPPGWPVPVVVVPYPRFLDDRHCDLAVSDDERTFVLDFQSELNVSVMRAAIAAGAYPFPGGVTAYTPTDSRPGLMACDHPAGVNFIHLLPHEGSFSGRLNPVNWKDGSLHPRAEGHQRMADLLYTWIGDALITGQPLNITYTAADFADLDQPVISLPKTNPIVDNPPTTGSDATQDTFETKWVTDRLFEIFAHVRIPLLLLLLAGFLIATGVYLLNINWLRFLFPQPTNNRAA